MLDLKCLKVCLNLRDHLDVLIGKAHLFFELYVPDLISLISLSHFEQFVLQFIHWQLMHWFFVCVPVAEHLALPLNGILCLVSLLEASVFKLEHIDVLPQLDDLSSLCLQVITFVLDVLHSPVEYLLLELQFFREELPSVSLIEYVVYTPRL